MQRLRGLKALVHDLVTVTTDLVEDSNESVAAKVLGVLEQVEPIAGPARVVDQARRLGARGVYESIHGVNHIVARLGDKALDAVPDKVPPPTIVPMRSDCIRQANWLEDASIAALNSAVGDFLHDQGNGLALKMQLRLGDDYVAPEAIEPRRIALFIHGVSVTEWCWCMHSEAYHGDPTLNFGTLLERDRGYTPVFLRYNSGRHISHNGRELAALLSRIDCDELILVGHSMGGLVARSACHYASVGDPAWLEQLTHVLCLGSPHQGAPLEKVGNVLTSVLERFDVPATQVPARILNARSAGIKDLRFGNLIDEDWQGRDPDAFMEDHSRDLPLVEDVVYAFLSTTLTEDANHPVGRILGDLMVRKDSARGPTETHDRFDVHAPHVNGVFHHEIQNHPEVYRHLLEVVSAR